MTKTNFKALDSNEYRGYKYEADINGKVCVFSWRTEYLTTVDTVEQADAYVNALEANQKPLS